MAVDQRRVERDWAIPPGEVLSEALVERGWTQAELARRTDRPLKTINEIVNGKAALTPDTALQLELVLGIPAHIWLNLERSYGEWQARQRAAERLGQAAGDWVARFPTADMTRHGLIEKSRSKSALAAALLRFFRVANESAWQRHWTSVPVALRKSRISQPKLESLAAWLRWGEIEADRIECRPFDPDALAGRLNLFRRFTQLDPFAFEDRLRSELAESGVALVMVPELSGTRLSGAARWLSPDKALVQLSLRHKSDDHFWFSLFHELGHLMTGSRRTTYVDVQIEARDDVRDEQAADSFASDSLIPSTSYEQFVRSGDFSPTAIKDFASSIQVSPGIVLGRLQHDSKIGPSKLNFLKRRIDFAH